MRKLNLCGTAAALALLAGGCAGRFSEPADVTMSPDGEVSSVAAAVATVRSLRAAGQIPADRAARVAVRPGTYRQTEPAVFGPDDSGIHFTGAGRGVSLVDGGIELPPFSVGEKGVWETSVPAGLRFDQCWVGGKRAQRARTPNRFYLYMKDSYDEDIDPVTGKVDEDIGRRAFYAESADVAPLAGLSAAELSRVLVVAWQSWSMSYCAVQKVDFASGLVTASGKADYPFFFWNTTKPRYALENYRAALDAPGEWFYDVEGGKLLYIPRPGETPSSVRAVVPVSQGLVSLNGTKERPVSDVRFTGVSFVHSGYAMEPTGYRAHQANSSMRHAAIWAEQTEGFVLEDAEVRHVGSHGIWLGEGCRRSAVRKTLVEDIGSGGVALGDTRTKDAAVVAHDLEIVNCIIRNVGVSFNGAIGVWLSKARDCRIEHNDIGDTRYSAVSMGWTWGYSPTLVRRNRLAWNRIHHVGWGTLSDQGGVYTLGDSEGTEVVNNWISDVNGYRGCGSPAWGLYTDEGSHHVLLASNLVERCRDGGIHQNYGKENTYRNNLFVDCERNQVWCGRIEPHVTIVVSNNVFCWREPETSAMWWHPTEKAVFGGNLYWCTAGRTSDKAFDGRTFDAWLKTGHDAGSVVADPQFVDPANGDWRLKPGSPALKAGFVPFDWRPAGILRDDPKWAALVDEAVFPKYEDAPSAPRFLCGAYRQDFDHAKLGGVRPSGRFKGFEISADSSKSIQVVARDGDKANRCVKFTSAERKTHPWMPHIYCKCAVTNGTATVRCAVKAGNDAEVTFECRDYHSPGGGFATGPSVRISGGRVLAGTTAVADIAADGWTEIELRLTLGVPAAPWTCTVRAPGKTEVAKDFRLPKEARFRSLEWIGFMSYGKRAYTWYLDDFELTSR